MPKVLVAISWLLPSNHAVEAFIRVRDMGATTADIAPAIGRLWLLTAIYGTVAVLLLANEIKDRPKRVERS